MLKVDSVRYKAFATNSSSVHTPILVTGKTPEDYLLDNGYDFGWGPFIAASQEAKQYYAALALRSNLRQHSLDIQNAILKDWVGIIPPDDPDHGYIDHQSIPVFPLEYSRKGVSKEYFLAYYKWLMQDRLVILGGNDNDDEGMCAADLGVTLSEPYLTDMNHTDHVVRKDPKGFFTIFNIKDGTKVRMAFDHSIDTSKGSTPELVDLKITNWCDNDCGYCYQGSHIGGKHANTELIHTILRALSEMQVLEVAIGGGEPTAHPDFWGVLRSAKNLGITPSFSTRRLEWMVESRNLQVFKESCGAFAYSVDSPYEVYTLAKMLYKYDLEERATIQLVPEACRFENAKAVMESAKSFSIPVTLLGLKTTGRGARYAEVKHMNSIRDFNAEEWKTLFETGANISVDTAFAGKHKELLKGAGVAGWSYKIKEGAHSMYYDAVLNKVGASSYGEMSCLVMPGFGADSIAASITEAFQSF